MMDREREKVIKGLEQFIADFKPFCGNKSDWQRVDDAIALLKAQEPVVRCRDCKWGIVTTDEDCEHIIAYCNNPDCPVWEADIAVKPDWYCADGERRDES